MNSISNDEASNETNALFDKVNRKMGRVPNMYKVMANSNTVLDAYLNFNTALSAGAIGPKLAEIIALATAEYNGCSYCLSAHTFLGKKVGLNDEEIDASRRFTSSNSKINVALVLVQHLLNDPTALTAADINPLRAAGYSDGEILEVIANVVRNIFTNYINIVSSTDVDWPVIVKPFLKKDLHDVAH